MAADALKANMQSPHTRAVALGLNADNGSYLTQIKTYPVLTEAEEHDLVRRWYGHADRKAFDALIGSHLRLVPKIAQKYAGYGLATGDLIGEGNLGLLQSAERFKPEKGFRFSTYARWWIKAAILNHILQNWSLLKVGNGAGKKRLFFNLRRAKRSLQPDGSRHLSEAEIAKLAHHFRVTKEDIVAMDQRMSANDVSLHQPVPGTEGLTVGDLVADSAPTPEDVLTTEDERLNRAAMLREALGQLDRREKEIVTKRYLTERPATLAKLATLYGLTAERVRQIEVKAITKLRQIIKPRRRGEAFLLSI
ncbi:MAG: RNA polymerase factor sigma-32 [Rhodospirillaceae bacterium]|nr:RNA polymerase factor sigma-32 [Rhodospirillaceae bacterium]